MGRAGEAVHERRRAIAGFGRAPGELQPTLSDLQPTRLFGRRAGSLCLTSAFLRPLQEDRGRVRQCNSPVPQSRTGTNSHFPSELRGIIIKQPAS